MSNRRRPTEALSDSEDVLLRACMELVPRLGASSFETRWSDPEHDGSPVVWISIATFERQGRDVHQVAAALTPARAAFRLLEQLVDGGQCTHCHRPTGITEDFGTMPADRLVCWHQFDPELSKFRRGCA